ncbi:MAG TPA: hypothetical protein VNV62_05115 [Trebonia sp.]|nr:hypothetical protein [Trebonia sp.]
MQPQPALQGGDRGLPLAVVGNGAVPRTTLRPRIWAPRTPDSPLTTSIPAKTNSLN